MKFPYLSSFFWGWWLLGLDPWSLIWSKLPGAFRWCLGPSRKTRSGAVSSAVEVICYITYGNYGDS